MKRRFIPSGFVVFLVSVLAVTFACSPSASPATQKVALSLTHQSPHGASLCEWGKHFAELCNKYAPGSVEYKEFAEGEMYSGGDEMAKSVLAGIIDMCIVGQSSIGAQGVPEISVGTIPHLISTQPGDPGFSARHDAFWSGAGGTWCKAEVEKKGGVMLDFVLEGSGVFATRKAINSLADLKGLKIRAPTAKPYVLTLQTFGMSGVQMGAGDQYVALQSGLIDGVQTSQEGLIERHLEEFCKFATFDLMPAATTRVLMINKSKWESLSPQLRDVITKKVIPESHAYVSKIIEKTQAEMTALYKSKGVTLYTLSPQELQTAVSLLKERCWIPASADFPNTYKHALATHDMSASQLKAASGK